MSGVSPTERIGAGVPAADENAVKLVIDQLESGGAQRQLCMLAAGLKRRGRPVEVLVYWKNDFFAGALADAGIPVVHVPSRNRPHLVYAMRRAVRRRRPDTVIAFLPGANMLAELAALPRRDFSLIVSERSLDVGGKSMRRGLRYRLHRLADAVVCNSQAQRELMLQAAPYLAEQTCVIRNGVDLERFRPGAPSGNGRPPERIRLLALGRLQPEKNPFGLLEAVDIVRKEYPGLDLTLDWYGDSVAANRRRDNAWSRRSRRKRADYYRKLEDAVAQRLLQDRFRLHRACHDVVPLYHAADALCLPSHYEGMSNAACEAMACALPVLAGSVGDTARLVKHGRNGFLFDPSSPADMADAIASFAALSADAKRGMGREGRKIAEAVLSPETMLDRYIDLIDRLRVRRGKARRT